MARRRRRAPDIYSRLNAPPPIEVKNKLDLRGLEEAYEWMKVSKVLGMDLARKWYDENVPIMLFRKPLGDASQKRFDQAAKALNLAAGSTLVDEKVQAYRTAFRIYEKEFKSFGIPPIDAAYQSFENGEKPSGAVARLAASLEKLNNIFGQFVSYSVTSEDERSYESAMYAWEPSKVYLSVKDLSEISSQPILKAAMHEAVNVAKIASVVDSKVDVNLFFERLPEMLDHALMNAGPDNVARAIRKAPTAKVPGAIRTRKSGNPRSLDSYAIRVLNSDTSKLTPRRAAQFSHILNGSTVKEYRQSLVAARFHMSVPEALSFFVTKGYIEVVDFRGNLISTF